MMSASGCEKAIFGVMGVDLSCSLREMLMREATHKQLSWFDRKDRAPGILTNIFSENVTRVKGMTSENIVMMAETFMTLALSVFFSFVICWQ